MQRWKILKKKIVELSNSVKDVNLLRKLFTLMMERHSSNYLRNMSTNEDEQRRINVEVWRDNATETQIS